LFYTGGMKNDYFDDFVFSQFEMDSIYKNYKVTSIEIECDYPFTYKIDDQPEENSSLSDNHIIIQKYMRNGKHVGIPIATFTPI
jgi:hypothetical protein